MESILMHIDNSILYPNYKSCLICIILNYILFA